MNIKIKYNNGTPDFEANLPIIKGWGSPIIELKVEGTSGRSRKTALYDYIINLQTAFKELINKHETDIEELEITDFFLGKLHKTSKDVSFTTISDKIDEQIKYNIILFSIYNDFVNESLYFTKNKDKVRETNLTFEGNILNQSVIEGKDVSEKERTLFLSNLITAVTCGLPNYDIQVNKETKKLEYCYKGAVLKTIDDIKEDDVFVFFKLVDVILHRGKHLGVYFIDCEYLSVNVIKTLIAFLNLYYRDKRLIFMYNVSNGQAEKLKDIKREIVVLPNQKITKKI